MRIRSIAVTLGVLVFLAACGSDPPSGPSGPRRRVELHPGQSTALSRTVTLTFDAVVNDSRCPIDAVCVTAGEAVIRLSARLASGATLARELRVGGPRPDSTTFEGVRIEVSELLPYPSASQPADPASYRAILSIGDE